MDDFLRHELKGASPLHRAAFWGDIPEVNRLINGEEIIIDVRDTKKRTPLHWAAYSGHAEIAGILINARANVNAQAVDGWTPLHVAAWRGHTETADVLIKRRACLRVRGFHDEKTPLDVAIAYHPKDSDIVRLLQDEVDKQGNK